MVRFYSGLWPSDKKNERILTRQDIQIVYSGVSNMSCVVGYLQLDLTENFDSQSLI